MLTVRRSCRLCGAALAEPVIRFEELPVAGAYLDPDAGGGADPVFPLSLRQCTVCGHTQLGETVAPEFYSSYRFVTGSGGGYGGYLDGLAGRLGKALPARGRVLEIGASDGTLLDLLARRGLAVAGFEPAAVPARQARERGVAIVEDFFHAESAMRSPLDAVDAIIIRHVIEHIDEFEPVFAGMAALASPEALLVVEVPSLEETVRQRNYGNVYHIHPNYFDQASLSRLLGRFGWQVESIETVPVFGGSHLAFARRLPVQATGNGCLDLRAFAEGWRHYTAGAREFFDRQRDAGVALAGYGAAERTVSILGTAGLDGSHIRAVYDSNPALDGLALPGTRIPVRAASRLAADNPEMVAIFARSFEDEIAASQQAWRSAGGRFVTLRTTPPEVL